MFKATINYPTYVKWIIDLQSKESADEILSTHTFKKVKRALRMMEGTQYSYRVEDVNEEYLKKFIPLYEDNIRSKENGVVRDVFGYVTSKSSKDNQFFSISLFKDDAFLGGMIYNYTKKNAVSVAYKVFPKEISLKLPINLSILAEYYLFQEGYKHGSHEVIHGKDRNCFGLTGAIGLAMYKCSIACVPHISRAKENEFLTEIDLVGDKDVFVFEGTYRGEKVLNATLFIADGSIDYQQKYQSLLQNTNFHTRVVLMK